MQKAKKIALGIVAALALLTGAALAAPFLFREQLIARAQRLINENIEAKVSFSGVSLSILRDFPDVSMRLNDFRVEGTGVFEGVRLLQADYLQAGVDLRSVLRRDAPLRIFGIRVASPVFHVLVTEEGKANYDIAKPSPAPADSLLPPPSEQILAHLEDISVSDARLFYDDASLGLRLALSGLQHQSSGDVSAARYVLDTYTQADSVTLDYAGIRYLSGAKADVKALFDVNADSSIYRFRENQMHLNDLALSAEGFVQLLEEGYAMDIALSSPENAFRDLLSLVPGVYTKGFEEVRADGRFTFNASVHGTYSDSLSLFPAYSLQLNISEGKVQYPGFPMGIREVNARISMVNNHSNADSLRVEVPFLGMRLGENPLKATFFLSTPISDPAVDGTLQGTLRLDDLARILPMEALKPLRGKIVADVRAKARMSQLERKDYASVTMSGKASVDNLRYTAPSMPALHIQSLLLTFSPQSVALSQLSARYGKSDVRGSARLDNILAWFSPQYTLRGTMAIQSNLLDANEIMAYTPTSPPDSGPVAASINAPTAPPALPVQRFVFDMDAAIAQLRYQEYEVRDIVAKGQLSPNHFSINQASARIGDSDVRVSGHLENGFDYLFQQGTLSGDIALQSKLLDLNPFLEQTDSAPSSSTAADAPPASVLPVPERMRLTLRADVGQLKYTNLTLNNVKGSLNLEDQTVAIQDLGAQTLGGLLAFNGLYDTRDLSKPAFRVRLDLERMDFQQSFKAFNTFRTLAPVGEYLSGLFSSHFLLEGFLGGNSIPIAGSLSAKGYLETINAFIKGYKPLQKMGQELRIAELQEDIKIENTKNWVEVKDGKIEVKPFDIKVKDIQLTIAGFAGLDKSLDYDIKVRMPRATFEKSTLGAAAGSTMRQVAQQAAQFGVQLTQGDYVNLLVKMSGTAKEPKFNVKLLGTDGQGSLRQSAEAEAQRQSEELIGKAEQAAGKALDSIRQRATGEAEKQAAELERKAREALEKQIGGKLPDTLVKQAEKVLSPSKARQEAEKLKKELEQFNPFKKKTVPRDTTKNQ